MKLHFPAKQIVSSNEVAFSCEVKYVFPVKCFFPVKWPNKRVPYVCETYEVLTVKMNEGYEINIHVHVGYVYVYVAVFARIFERGA